MKFVLDTYFTTVAYPIRGTPYFEEVSNRVAASGPWPETSDRSLRIRGRHSRRFYQNAGKLLAAEVALDKLSDAAACESNPSVIDLRRQIEKAREALQTASTETEA